MATLIARQIVRRVVGGGHLFVRAACFRLSLGINIPRFGLARGPPGLLGCFCHGLLLLRAGQRQPAAVVPPYLLALEVGECLPLSSRWRRALRTCEGTAISKSWDLPKYLERPNRRIEALFPGEGFASVVAIQPSGKQVEVGLIGREGRTGLPIVLGDNRSPHATYI